MKKISICFFAITVILISLNADAQQKKTISQKTRTTVAAKIKFKEPSFAGLINVEEISDINPRQLGYDAVRMLSQDYRVPLAFSDKTFRGKT